MQNWLVCDPSVIMSGAGSNVGSINSTPGTTNFWRPGTYLGIPATNSLSAISNAVGTADTDALNTAIVTFPSYIYSMIAPVNFRNATKTCVSGASPYNLSNDFFMYFSFEDTPRPGMLSGKNTMDGSNYLNVPLVAAVSYTYNIYFIGIYDALIVHRFEDSNVFMIS